MKRSKYPNKVRVLDLLKTGDTCQAKIDGKWVPARPIGFQSFWRRCSLAWLVFTGKADALIWPGGQ